MHPYLYPYIRTSMIFSMSIFFHTASIGNVYRNMLNINNCQLMYNARLFEKLLIKKSPIFHWRKMNSSETLSRSIENSIRKKIEIALKPLYCDVINESCMHNVPEGSETHFKIVVVSEKFDKQPLIKRHQAINELLHAELGNIHALSIVSKTPKEWEASNKKLIASPVCRGGFNK